MDNASKALIIAGSILIALIIISLAVMVFNRFGGTAREMADLDQQEIDSFNSKITPYCGKNISGSQVRALVQLCRSIDQSAITTGNKVKRISAYLHQGGTTTTLVELFEDGNVITFNGLKEITTNKFYNVERTFGNSGLITRVDITLN